MSAKRQCAAISGGRASRGGKIGRRAQGISKIGASPIWSHKYLPEDMRRANWLVAHMGRPAARSVDGFGNIRRLAVDRADLFPQLDVSHDNESPILCISPRRRADRGIQYG